MVITIGIVVRTINSAIYDYAVALPEGNFFVFNGDEFLTEDNYDKPVIVKYDPQDQFCHVVRTPIIIDPESVANEIKARGVTMELSGWTNTLVDVLEEKYNLETTVHNLFKEAI